MPSAARRTVLRSVLGTAVLGLAVPVRSRSEVSVDERWRAYPAAPATFVDAARLDDDTLVIAVNPRSAADQSDQPDLVALDRRGDHRWAFRLGEVESATITTLQAVAATPDGGLVLGGPSSEDDVGMAIAKLGADRTVEWERSYEHRYSRLALVAPTSSRLVSIGTETPSAYVLTTIRGLNATDGTVDWENDSFREDYFPLFARPSEGGIVLGGSDPSHRGFVARLSSDGTEPWDEPYTADILDSVDDVAIAPSGELVVVGPQDGERDDLFRLIALDSDGRKQWAQANTVEGNELLGSVRILPSPDGGYVVATDHWSRNDVFVGWTDDRGVLEASALFAPGDHRADLGAVFSMDGTIVLTGDLEPRSDSDDEERTWALGLDRTSSTATPTRTSRPTRTIDASPTPTRSPSRTRSAVPTPTRSPDRDSTTASTRSRTTTIDGPTPSTTADGPLRTDSRTTTAETPGFGISTAVTGTLLAAYMRLRGANDADR